MPPPVAANPRGTITNAMHVPEGAAPGQKADSGPLKKLNDPSTFTTAVYPQNIETTDHYMKIGAFEKRFFAAGSRQARNEEQTKIIQSIILPMPSGLQTGYQQRYKEENLGAIGVGISNALTDPENKLKGREALDAITGAAKTGKGIPEAFDKTTDLVAGVISSTAEEIGRSGVASVGLSAAPDLAIAGLATVGLGGAAIGGGVSAGIQAAVASEGLARNPHQAVMYEHPLFRTFNFSWELRPKNFVESVNIQRIIAFFKFYSAPRFKFSNHFFDYPNQFKLNFRHPEFLFSFGDCVLTNFSVDYHGEGTPLYYDASGSRLARRLSGKRNLKAPAVVKISTEWQETTIITKDTFEKEGR